MAKAVWLRLKIILGLDGILLVLHLANLQLDGRLMALGIVPRDADTWYHIFSAPFIHASSQHLLNNIIGLNIFTFIGLLRPAKDFFMSSVFIIAMTGVLVWLFARPAVHVGASGWVFGLWSLSITTAWFDRSLKNLLIAAFVLFLYGGMVYGVLPTKSGVSFESHLFVAISGIMMAAILSKRG